MGIASEAARETVVFGIATQIVAEMTAQSMDPKVVASLKKIGRFALDQLEMSTPAWAATFAKAFADEDEMVLKTPDEWLAGGNIRVLDPDGWRNAGIAWTQPITKKQFNTFLMQSTIEILATTCSPNV